MSNRVVIRLADLASFPAQEARPAIAAAAGKRGKTAKPQKPARIGKLPVSPATVWRWVREGKFPKPFKLGNGVTVWNEDEVDAFIARKAEDK